MAATKISKKQLKVDQANKKVVIILGVASFVLVFCLMASKTLLSDYQFQSRVIAAKHTAVDQLKTDKDAVSSLVNSYKALVSTPLNVLGKPTTINGVNYDNGVVLLDALPSQYDFPGLVSSLDNYFSGQQVQIISLNGTDEEVSQQKQSTPTTMHPSAVPIPLTMKVSGTYPSIQNFINRLQSSIRPFQVQKIELSGTDGALTANVNLTTYYQPGVKFQISKESIQ